MRWWYSAGWSWVWQRAVLQRIEWCLETFSMTTLIATWFAPFKQTYAGNVNGAIGLKIRAFFDRQISRVIGFIVRSILLLTGLICLVFAILSGFLLIALWGIIPLLPIVSIILIAMGVGRG